MSAPALNLKPATPRRRLADNVVCLFQEERPAVVQSFKMRPTRLPRGVVHLPPPEGCSRFKNGSVFEMCGDVLPSNLGKRVAVVKLDIAQDRWIRVRTLGEPIDCFSLDDPLKSTFPSQEAWVSHEVLRRVHRAYLKGGAA